MSNPNPANPGPAHSLPERANLEHLRKEAKQRLKAMRIDNPGATLAAAQLAVAREYGFTSWRRLAAYVKAQRDKEAQLRDQRQAANTFAQVPQAIRDGSKAEGKSDYKTAAAHFRKAIAESPTFIPAYYRLGRALVRQQLYSEALEAFEGLLKVDPENLLAHYEIGKLHLSFRKYPDEVLLKFDLENLLPHYEKLLLLDGIGKLQLSDQRYVDAITNNIPRRQFAPDNLLADHEIGKLYLSARNYADAIVKYRWLKAQTDNPMNHMADPSFELLSSKPRTDDIARHPKHQAYAAELALYLLDLIPPEVAEQHHLPSSQIVFAAPMYIPEGQREVVWCGDQPVRKMNQRLRATPLYHEKAKSTEIARINRTSGTVSLRGIIDVVGRVTNIRVLRGLPDGLTRRAIHALQQFRFQPATIDGTPVSVLSGKYDFGFKAEDK